MKSDNTVVTVEVEVLNWPKCARCRRNVPWLINLGICGRCRDVVVEAGWIVHNPATGDFEFTDPGKIITKQA